MFTQIQEFVSKDRSILVDQVSRIRKDSVDSVREAVAALASYGETRVLSVARFLHRS